VPAGRGRCATLLIAIGLVVAGCGGSADSDGTGEAASTTTSAAPESSPPPATTSPAPPPATGTVITVGDSEFGPMLFDDRGQAIYLFDQEDAGTPVCYDECAEAWPPVLTDGAPQPAGEAQASLLGTTQRSDGSVQVTYAGHPLYFYANEDPGEVLCHDVFLNGGTWYVITPEGGPGPT
jgi:predicted lipoprotein with Yx(FWY)xxD motif